MRLSRYLKRLVLPFAIGAFVFGSPAVAGPIEITPVVVKGELAPYSRVKKHGRIWYPASVVGHHRGINFAYDYATQKLYANGVETYIESVVVDRVVYLDISPEVTQQGMRPGMDSLAARRAQLKAYDSASSHLEGRSDALFMSQNVPYHEHPWTKGASAQNSPIIDLDPTHEAHAAPLMREGARPPEAAPEPLPNRLPRPGERPATNESVQTVQIVPPAEGIPKRVTEEGGPSATATQPVEVSQPVDPGLVVDPTGLQPIPKQPEVAPDTSEFSSSGKLKATSRQNSVFKVDVVAGSWQVSSDNLLRLKLAQANISQVAQSNLGSFALRCADGSRVEASRTRSFLPDGTLAPGSLREGELVFRLSSAQKPESLELEGALGLSVPLHQM